ncbi:cation:proton antiporter [Stieleria sp. TO1_6]|uniref:cation:proton antiporter domain-containing protein n=1 Tax=Stieleria tagensis TaxID=2956795 RepID=UPI00209A9619|nr:cation:proton antiporter [Stieleria tagensis]MCO8121132.1 cation:proton antiporter [Stieleria tagensis]
MHSNELLVTFTSAAALGVCLFALAYYLRVSAIAVLLIGGVLAGPQGIGLVHPDSLGDGLGTLISLAVAIILFEGGLTLDLKGYRSASKEIISVLTIGVVVTWLGSAALLRMMFGFEIAFCLLAASLIIVTGPTVIGPLLHRIRVREKLGHILHWEGVLIDPIGVFIALLCYEFYLSTDGTHQSVLTDFLLRFATGGAIGVAFGFLLDFVLRRELIRKQHTNNFVVAMAMLNFAIAHLVIAESGLLSVTIAGLVLGSRNTPQLREIVTYKVELKDFLIGLLFVLLAANLDLMPFFDFGWRLVAVVAGIMLLIRPINIFLSMRSSSLSRNEKLFLSWIAPRGIVAASMASVFTLELKQRGIVNAGFLETFTYSVIVGTVIVQGFSAGLVARRLGVVRPVSTGWVIVGANLIGRQVAQFFADHGVEVVLIDTNAREVRSAQRAGLVAISEDAMLLNPKSHVELFGCGNLLALTPNADLNRMLCQRWSEILEGSVYRWEQTGHETQENRHLFVGQRIWDTLPLNRWMQPNTTASPLRVMRSGLGKPPRPIDVMMTARGEGVFPGTPAELQDEDQQWLVYDAQHSGHTIALPLVPKNVLFSSQTDLKELYREMLVHLQRQLPNIDPDRLVTEMWKREEDYTSLLGHGIALPHAWTNQVTQATLVVARPENAICCPLTDCPIDIVFMLLSPLGQPDEHLRHLSYIARLVGTESKRAGLQQATDSNELYHTIAAS